MEMFAEYGHAIVAVLIYALLALVLNAATGIKKGALNLAPGDTHSADFDNAAYRLDRAYMNTIEMLAFFAPIVAFAILAGADPFMLNIAASAGLVLRVIANVLMIRGHGKPYGGLRTNVIILHSIASIAMVLLGVAAVFSAA
jgi:uncharacterized MAPEG superfamily protein